MSDIFDIMDRRYPVAVLQDRYNGSYSGRLWLAIAEADHMDNGCYRIVRCIEDGPSGDDISAQEFWHEPPGWIAVGSTAEEAICALASQDMKEPK